MAGGRLVRGRGAAPGLVPQHRRPPGPGVDRGGRAQAPGAGRTAGRTAPGRRLGPDHREPTEHGRLPGEDRPDPAGAAADPRGMTAVHTATALGELHAVVAGRVIAPGDAGYDRARTVAYAIDRRPAAVVRARSTADVSRVVRLARERGLELAVRSGGHSPAGHGTTDGGIVLDLGGLKSLDIDARRRTAWAGAGLTAGEYTAATAAHGLATGFGDTGSVGLGGITLSGGIG